MPSFTIKSNKNRRKQPRCKIGERIPATEYPERAGGARGKAAQCHRPNLATINIKAQRLNEAEGLLNTALAINPDYANARGLLSKLQALKIQAAKNEKKRKKRDIIQPD